MAFNTALSETILLWQFLSRLLFRGGRLSPMKCVGSSPKVDIVGFIFTSKTLPALVSGSTHTAFTAHGAWWKHSLHLLSQSPSQQVPISSDGMSRRLLSQGVLPWKGCLVGWWAMRSGTSVTWEGFPFHLSFYGSLWLSWEKSREGST